MIFIPEFVSAGDDWFFPHPTGDTSSATMVINGTIWETVRSKGRWDMGIGASVSVGGCGCVNQ
jgi:hypothetical protein